MSKKVTEEELIKVTKEKLSLSITAARFLQAYFAEELEKYGPQDQHDIICKLVIQVIYNILATRKNLEKMNDKISSQEILFHLFRTIINNRQRIIEQIPDVWLKIVKEKK